MEYRDLESGTSLPRSLNIRRRWHELPRAIRVYSIFGGIFLLSFILIYTCTKPLSNENYRDIEKFQTDSTVNSDNSDLNSLVTTLFVHEKNYRNQTSIEVLNSEVWKSIKLNKQQIKIKAAVKDSWDAYRKFAWGKDHLLPISQTGSDWFGIGLTILDSLDTLLMTGLTDEYKEGLNWVKQSLTFDKNNKVNCFETTIRGLGGLLSAYHISGDKILLDKANDLGSRLIHCFDSGTKVPFSDVDLKYRRAHPPAWLDSSLSEVSSMQIEFRDLSFETQNKTYEEKSFETSKHIHELVIARGDPILPMFISPRTGHLTSSVLTLGARSDSYYEYLYKQYLQIKESFLLDDWMYSIDKIHEKLLRSTKGKLQLWYIGEIFQNGVFSPKMDHLVCFLAGTLALSHYHQTKNSQTIHGHVIIENQKLQMHLKMAEDLARTCHYMYNLTETGLGPEIGYFGTEDEEPEYVIRQADRHNLLRPEFVESLFFLYHITGKQIYREYGLQVFNAFEKYSKVSTGGYTTLKDVRHPKRTYPLDKMESFWIAETLKYLYLLFTDDKRIVDALLNRYIFNSEGHLFPRRIL